MKAHQIASQQSISSAPDVEKNAASNPPSNKLSQNLIAAGNDYQLFPSSFHRGNDLTQPQTLLSAPLAQLAAELEQDTLATPKTVSTATATQPHEALPQAGRYTQGLVQANRSFNPAVAAGTPELSTVQQPHPRETFTSYLVQELIEQSKLVTEQPDNSLGLQERTTFFAKALLNMGDLKSHLDLYPIDKRYSGLAFLVNQFSQYPDNPSCYAACAKIAIYITNLPSLQDFSAKDLSNISYGLNQWPNNPSCFAAADTKISAYITDIASYITDLPSLQTINSSKLSNIIDKLSQWPDDPACYAACAKIASYITDLPSLQNFSGKDIKTLLDGISQWPEDRVFFIAGKKLSEHYYR